MKITETADWYTIDADSRTRQARITLRGLWDDAAFASFDQALVRAIGRLIAAGAPYGTYRTLIDLRGQNILTQRVAELAKGLATGPSTDASERIAIVVSGALHKLQQARISTAGHARLFLEYAVAEAWLLSDE